MVNSRQRVAAAVQLLRDASRPSEHSDALRYRAPRRRQPRPAASPPSPARWPAQARAGAGPWRGAAGGPRSRRKERRSRKAGLRWAAPGNRAWGVGRSALLLPAVAASRAGAGTAGGDPDQGGCGRRARATACTLKGRGGGQGPKRWIWEQNSCGRHTRHAPPTAPRIPAPPTHAPPPGAFSCS
jgi:hypothetical protein